MNGEKRVAQRGGAATKQVETRLSPRMSMWPQPLFTRPPCTDVKNPCQKNKNLRACNADRASRSAVFLRSAVTNRGPNREVRATCCHVLPLEARNTCSSVLPYFFRGVTLLVGNSRLNE